MKLVKPGVYTVEKDLSTVWFCECCNRAFKTESHYLSHIRNVKIKQILKR